MSHLSPDLDLDDLSPAELQTLVRLANQLYFRTAAWDRTAWAGHKAVKCPGDLWATQEIITRTRPDVLVETGTWAGGSALFYAHLFDALGHGRVVTVDLVEQPGRPTHPRITYLQGDSVAPETLTAVRAEVADAASVMVVLDSAHRTEHVAAECAAYAELVTVGHYLIVEDTAFDGWPAWPAFGPGPAAAVQDFLASRRDFEVDPEAVKHLLTLAPGGFLRRVR